jgi:hypothetical protein
MTVQHRRPRSGPCRPSSFGRDDGHFRLWYSYNHVGVVLFRPIHRPATLCRQDHDAVQPAERRARPVDMVEDNRRHEIDFCRAAGVLRTPSSLSSLELNEFWRLTLSDLICTREHELLL